MYREQPVGPALDRWAECVWSIESAEPIRGHTVRPDGCIDILYSPAGLQAVGAMTSEQRYDLARHAHTVGLRFRPGMAAAFLRVDAAELTDRVIALEDLLGAAARDLSDRLDNASSPETVLTAAIRPPAPEPNPVQRAIEAVTSSHGDIDLDWVARQAGMSERQFRRRCLQESGLSPKQLCRVLRFRRACGLGERGLPWGLIAAESGYFDQAHLIRDFLEFTGATPMQMTPASVSVFSNTSPTRSG